MVAQAFNPISELERRGCFLLLQKTLAGSQHLQPSVTSVPRDLKLTPFLGKVAFFGLHGHQACMCSDARAGFHTHKIKIGLTELCLLSVGIKGMCHHVKQKSFYQLFPTSLARPFTLRLFLFSRCYHIYILPYTIKYL